MLGVDHISIGLCRDSVNFFIYLVYCRVLPVFCSRKNVLSLILWSQVSRSFIFPSQLQLHDAFLPAFCIFMLEGQGHFKYIFICSFLHQRNCVYLWTWLLKAHNFFTICVHYLCILVQHFNFKLLFHQVTLYPHITSCML